MTQQWRDEARAWLEPAFEAAAVSLREQPEQGWPHLRRSFLDALALQDPAEHDVALDLFSRLDGLDDEARSRTIADLDVRDELVRELLDTWEPHAGDESGDHESRDHVEFEHADDGAGEHEHDEADSGDEAHDPAAAAAAVVDELGADAFVRLVRDHPDLAARLSPDDIRAQLGDVLAERLAVATGQGA